MIRIIIEAKGVDPNTGEFKKMRTVDIENQALEYALGESWGKAWIVGAEILAPPYKGD